MLEAASKLFDLTVDSLMQEPELFEKVRGGIYSKYVVSEFYFRDVKFSNLGGLRISQVSTFLLIGC
jgi:hypothetical protein